VGGGVLLQQSPEQIKSNRVENGLVLLHSGARSQGWSTNYYKDLGEMSPNQRWWPRWTLEAVSTTTKG
jgi:DNA gyrase/topoisomerase IV subunit B